MIDPTNPRDTFSGPRVIHEDAAHDAARPIATAPAPTVFATEETERVVPRERAAVTQPPRAMLATPRRLDRWVRLGLYGVGIAFAGWLGVDAYLWISIAFASSATLGTLATAAVAAGVVGAGLVIGRELKSFFALKSVEANQRLLDGDVGLRSADMVEAIREVLAVIPKDRESEAAIEAYQRQAQPHHTPAQQLELLSRTVMTPLDRRAEAVVRRATARAFGITAVSPTPITDAIFFIVMSVRMVRGIAACYGHRPTAAATTHLLRRLVVEAGRLGAVDLAGMTITQHIGGALAERLAANTAEAMYAGQRMASRVCLEVSRVTSNRVGGCFVLEDRQQFSVVKDDASPKFDRKSPNSRSKKTSAARRKTVKRQPVFKSDNWYEKAALSMAIRAKL